MKEESPDCYCITTDKLKLTFPTIFSKFYLYNCAFNFHKNPFHSGCWNLNNLNIICAMPIGLTVNLIEILILFITIYCMQIQTKYFSFGNSVLKDIILYSIFNKINFLLPPLPETPSTHRLTVNLQGMWKNIKNRLSLENITSVFTMIGFLLCRNHHQPFLADAFSILSKPNTNSPLNALNTQWSITAFKICLNILQLLRLLPREICIFSNVHR